MENPVMFALTVLGLHLAPGPSNALLATAGATLGVRSEYIAIEASAYLAAVLILHFAIGPFIPGLEEFSWPVRIFVSSYLIWISVKLFQARDTPEARAVVSCHDVFIATLLNPKTAVFAFMIIPFENSSWLVYMLAFIFLTLLAGSVWHITGAAIGHSVKLVGGTRIINYTCAVGMLILAGMVLSFPFSSK